MIGGAAQPFWAGLATFFRARAGGLEDVRAGDPVVVGAPFDGGVTLGRQGSKHGPRSIREASCYLASIEAALPDGKLYNVDTGAVRSRYSTDRLLDVGDADCYQLDPSATYESVKAGVSEIARRGGIPALLGGDHYLCFPGCSGMVEGIKQGGAATNCAYIHVDSHTDFWDEYGYGGKHNHATSVRRLWESGLVAADQMLWLGLNGTMPLEHYECIRREGMHFVTAEQLMESNWESTVAQALTRIAGAGAVYISLDIDVLNGAEAPGTGGRRVRGDNGETAACAATSPGGVGPARGCGCVRGPCGLRPSGANGTSCCKRAADPART